MTFKESVIKITATIALYISLRLFMWLAKNRRQKFLEIIKKHNPKIYPAAVKHFSGNNQLLFTVGFIGLTLVWWFKDLFTKQ